MLLMLLLLTGGGRAGGSFLMPRLLRSRMFKRVEKKRQKFKLNCTQNFQKKKKIHKKSRNK
jgi:hypothetical protein